MRRSLIFRFGLPLLLLCAWVQPLRAESEMDIIALRHRTVEQMLPILEPLVKPDGLVTGMNNRIIVRGSPRTRAQIRQAIEAFDTPIRSLLIEVKQDNELSDQRSGVGMSGSVGSDAVRIGSPERGDADAHVGARRGDDRLSVRAYSTRGSAADRISQRVQVVEGGRAFIQVGRSLPIAFTQMAVGRVGAVVSQGTVYKDIGSGFYAVPQLNGERLTLEIVPQNDSLSETQYGEIRRARLSTTLQGRLGEWMELGGSGVDSTDDQRGLTRYSTRSGAEVRRIWVRVSEVP